MEVDYLKFVLCEVDEHHLKDFFLLIKLKLQDEFKYLGFTIKYNGYGENN